jgi:hypothetical protein
MNAFARKRPDDFRRQQTFIHEMNQPGSQRLAQSATFDGRMRRRHTTICVYSPMFY